MTIWKISFLIGSGITILLLFWCLSLSGTDQALLALLCTIGMANFSVLSYLTYVFTNKHGAHRDGFHDPAPEKGSKN